ncbi:hypothetical protein CCUS01_06448 [Colletotrichum cuscutae]|uniref:Uncharacterized protein n=1 Tax=Colletotrichum cuscutae TaxID=1209917 RepID=A0AAI9Y3P9_9PEZI|nr:hypothetical protein CCUS01_06448 [Colletotrichum cuscutae]
MVAILALTYPYIVLLTPMQPAARNTGVRDTRQLTGLAAASELKSRATRAGRASWAHLFGRASHLRKGRGLAIEDTITATLRHRAFSWLAVLSTAFPATRPFFVVGKDADNTLLDTI